MSGRSPAPTERGGALFSTSATSTRGRSAEPGERAHGRTAKRAEATSDVRRLRGLVTATAAGAAAALAAAALTSASTAADHPLARPHAEAGLTCSACHAASPAARTDADDPSRACAGCHGEHGSTRSGHARALASGAMRCATCHAIHESEQGVTFAPDAAPVRFGSHGAIALASDGTGPARAFRPAGSATVALVTAASCAGCHDLDAPSDPVARCLLADQEVLGSARPVVCFDEHQLALPRDAALGAHEQSPAVCAGQHVSDRAAAWEAARSVAAASPLASSAVATSPLTPVLAGVSMAGLALAGLRAAEALRARRKALKNTPVTPPKPPARIRLPQIDTSTCLGCYACVDACPYSVLAVERYVAVVVRPEACCGLTLCEQKCPNGSLAITDGAPIGDRPRIDAKLASLDAPGVYLAGDVTGLPLIKNAIAQGAHAASEIAASLGTTRRSSDVLDLLIVGAGPAGLSAALKAKELGLAFVVVEQGGVAQSIQSFPRGKLVFDQPLELPLVGKLWLQESSKEELLARWLRLVRKERIPVHEGTRLMDLARLDGDLLEATTEPRDGGAAKTWRARRVLLAIGQRGTPRLLPFELDPSVLSRVHYHLADARSFAGMRVVIAGLGDVAMEAAFALSRQPNATVTLVHRGVDFSRGSPRNIAEVKRLVASGRVALRLESELSGITQERALVRGPVSDPIACDAVLVLIGSVPPWEALRRAGVRKVFDGPAPLTGA